MNSKKRGRALLITALCLTAFGCAHDRSAPARESFERTERKVIAVKIPTVRNEKLSAEERHWQFQKFLFPQITVPDPVPEGLPHDDSLLWVKLEADGTLKINTEKQANGEALEKKLTEIFRNREQMRVLEPNGERAVKAVLVIAPDSAKYSEVFTLLEQVENSGADPIVLQIGEPPTAVIFPKP